MLTFSVRVGVSELMLTLRLFWPTTAWVVVSVKVSTRSAEEVEVHVRLLLLLHSSLARKCMIKKQPVALVCQTKAKHDQQVHLQLRKHVTELPWERALSASPSSPICDLVPAFFAASAPPPAAAPASAPAAAAPPPPPPPPPRTLANWLAASCRLCPLPR